eukprot:CAMPEP_0202691396 /NCGR_PEP_ID=MMETSP1385-20130828/6130_1 /ASSEMBLY_ACC=CAM_ASM_000861 /TAXON_ID=933848 /ORGANISM="Elphidium margaritaceum" /LENGTH=379 /DNA_ID=CAMNT_0049346797 /DNA_START=19 /DNA_END=1158 /DNA_ORIENTATION=+
MGNANTAKQRKKQTSEKHTSNAANYSYAETLQMIETELLRYVDMDMSSMILSYIPRSTIGDESNPINPYDVLTVHIHIVSAHSKIPPRLLSIFNAFSPNCHCGAVLAVTSQSDRVCVRCHKHCADYECPAKSTTAHDDDYVLCNRCVMNTIEVLQEDDGELFAANSYYDPPRREANHRFYAGRDIATLKAGRRVCLAFTNDYVRVYLHCFSHSAAPRRDHSDFCKALCTSEYEWRQKKSKFTMNDTHIGILMEDFSADNWQHYGERWTDFIEQYCGGGAESIFIALCHCNQTHNKLDQAQKENIENFLVHKKTEMHSIAVETLEKCNPWKNLCAKLFTCSVTENEDAITAVLDVVGIYLANLNEAEKNQLTYRAKFKKE